MIAIAVILALSAVFITGLVVFWRKIVEWIKKGVNKLKEALGIVVKGVKTFTIRTAHGFINKQRLCYQNEITHEWEMRDYTTEVNEREIPADILAKVYGQALDVEVSTTEELRLAISA